MGLTKKIDWLPGFFSTHADRIKRILPAGGCRELWLQGEIYLYLSGDGLLTNATQRKYDLYMEGGFVMELKILGGDYQRKVLSYRIERPRAQAAHLENPKEKRIRNLIAPSI